MNVSKEIYLGEIVKHKKGYAIEFNLEEYQKLKKGKYFLIVKERKEENGSSK